MDYLNRSACTVTVKVVFECKTKDGIRSGVHRSICHKDSGFILQDTAKLAN